MKKILLIFFIGTILSVYGRSIYRPTDPYMPEIITRWVGQNQHYSMRRYHLEEYSLLNLFDLTFFNQYLLPENTSLTYRNNPQKSVMSQILIEKINNLLNEIKRGNHKFSDFTILQSKDYNFKKMSGLLIVKFNDYPFVVKIFIETPDSFICPFDKGIEPIFCFFMSGGINRHLLGFTRIKNREILINRVKNSSWASLVDIPRKWHWIPKNSRWIELTGLNLGGLGKKQTICFPGTYCVIADAIEAERTPSLFNAQDKKMALDLCNFLDIWVDPHMQNFLIEKKSKKFVIVDTEHFPSFTGLREKINFDSYSNWYLYLAGKCWRNTFMQTKKERRNPKKPSPEMSLVTAR